MYVTIFDRDRGQKTSLTKLVLKRSVLKQSLPNFQHKLLQTSQYEAYIEAAQNFIRYVTIFDRDRGQKTSLTKLVFSGKFLGCFIEAAQNFIRYVTIFDRDRGQKTSLTKLLLKRSVLKQSLPNQKQKLLLTSQYESYIEAAQNFFEGVHFLSEIGDKKLPSLNLF